jgi:hypothetical protein
MEKKKPSNSHQASYHTTYHYVIQQHNSTAAEEWLNNTNPRKRKQFLQQQNFPQVPGSCDSPVFKFAETFARLRNNDFFFFPFFPGKLTYIFLRKIIRAVLLYYFCTTYNTTYCGTQSPIIYLLKLILAI